MEDNPTGRLRAKILAYNKGRMIRQSRAEKVLGRIDRGVHILQKGISIAHGAYTIGRTLAPLAAAMV